MNNRHKCHSLLEVALAGTKSKLFLSSKIFCDLIEGLNLPAYADHYFSTPSSENKCTIFSVKNKRGWRRTTTTSHFILCCLIDFKLNLKNIRKLLSYQKNARAHEFGKWQKLSLFFLFLLNFNS